VSDLSPREVAVALGVSRSAVYRLIEDGELPAYRVRGRLRVEPAEVRAFKQRNRVKPRNREGVPMYEPAGFPTLGDGGRFAAELKAMKGAM
jgi:excisionase family DNA binding protein